MDLTNIEKLLLLTEKYIENPINNDIIEITDKKESSQDPVKTQAQLEIEKKEKRLEERKIYNRNYYYKNKQLIIEKNKIYKLKKKNMLVQPRKPYPFRIIDILYPHS